MTDTTTEGLRDLADRIADGTAGCEDFGRALRGRAPWCGVSWACWMAYRGEPGWLSLIEPHIFSRDLALEIHNSGERTTVHWHSRADPGIATAQGADEARTRLLAAIRAMIWLADQ